MDLITIDLMTETPTIPEIVKLYFHEIILGWSIYKQANDPSSSRTLYTKDSVS
jgi:hypothetical protein